jgi:hypothetical protein
MATQTPQVLGRQGKTLFTYFEKIDIIEGQVKINS